MEPAGAAGGFRQRRRRQRAAAAVGEEAAAVAVTTTARLGNVRRCVEGEQAAAGWPSWLSAVAAEAVHGGCRSAPRASRSWRRSGRARTAACSGRGARHGPPGGAQEGALRQRGARERAVHGAGDPHPPPPPWPPQRSRTRGTHHLRSSSSIYLVFEYLEHDLAGLNSSPDITFTEPQIKCYMRQLLEGLAHCHARGVMHRDIKCANLLVSNGGELKVADFGLANLFAPASAAPLTSRVVTLWYRPPELLLGATAYEPSVDLWSSGCVFAEMHARRPVLQGRTEVEQIHKIFKLCGSPPDDFWRRSGISHAAVFRPQQPYPSRLRDTFAASMPSHAFRLLATLLSLDPAARGTAAAALDAEYFTTAPYACEPASLPKYAPNKEMDAKFREESRRRSNLRSQGGEAAKRLSRGHKSMQLQDTNQSHVHAEESLPVVAEKGAAVASNDGSDSWLFVDLEPVPAISKRHGGGAGDGDVGDHAAPCARTMSSSFKEPPRVADRLPLSGPVQLAASTGFAWAKKPRPDATMAPAVVTKRSGSKGPGNNNNNNGGGDGARTTFSAATTAAAAAPYEVEKQEMIKQWAQVADAFSASEAYNSRFRQTLDAKQLKTGKMYKGKVNRVDYSGPLLSQPRRIDELLHNHEQQIRQAGRRSWFKKGSKKEQN
ncbi:unnamed protein product [Miscanthus lutarioriparius]|uniref:[RNA-polymerase]-subunit kinase n=1 Tax=Miscanthus lutarioriparius TaxID=422564 RepID=A0A811RAN9_9POAL|nr:unnamed protein product [Miscanthus lutarioriparius]